MSKWSYEKFKGDIAIYAFCPVCNFHYVCGDTFKRQIMTEYTYCPMCGEYLYNNEEEADIIYNVNDYSVIEDRKLNWEIIRKER